MTDLSGGIFVYVVIHIQKLQIFVLSVICLNQASVLCGAGIALRGRMLTNRVRADGNGNKGVRRTHSRTPLALSPQNFGCLCAPSLLLYLSPYFVACSCVASHRTRRSHIVSS